MACSPTGSSQPQSFAMDNAVSIDLATDEVGFALALIDFLIDLPTMQFTMLETDLGLTATLNNSNGKQFAGQVTTS